MGLNPWERRQKLLEVLCLRRFETTANLAREFDVSTRTIRNDITVLTCSYPIEAVKDGHGGGIRVAEWFHLDRRTLNADELELLRRLARLLHGRDLDVMNRIITQFSHRGGYDHEN